MAWITPKGQIYYGAQNLPDDVQIPDAPDQFHDWNSEAWVLNTDRKAMAEREEWKQQRQAAVDAITVTVNGKVFDGDEVSQTRMARAIIGMQAAQAATINWTLADNTVTQATVAELTEALILAGQRQAELWVQA